MKILALNTAMDGVGVGFYDSSTGQSAVRDIETVRGQATHLVPMVQDVLAEAGCAFADLDAVVAVVGPGSFTGVRLCLSAAKSFGLALDIPVYGVSSLQALACQYGGACMVLIETKRTDYYMQCFDAEGVAVSDAGSFEEPEVRAVYDEFDGALIGDAVARFGPLSSDDYSAIDLCAKIDPVLLARLLVEKPDVFLDNAEPLYLRGADVSVSRRVQRALAD